MLLKILFLVFMVAFVHGYETQQVQMPEADAMMLPDEDLASQVQTLQRNISELWTYIHELKGAVTTHLNHLRQHQEQLENSVDKLEHKHEGSETHSSHVDPHHSDEQQHSHSGDQHAHEDHHHSGEYHSHGDDQHSHSDDYHSHGESDHAHGESDHAHDSHGDDYSHAHSHSHSGHSESDSHHHHDHKDSHESLDDFQQTSQVVEPLIEPVVASQSHQGGSFHGNHIRISSSSTVKPRQVQLDLDFGNHHHHHGSSLSPSSSLTRNRTSRTVVMPKYSEYDLYNFAVCNVRPNRAIPNELQQDVNGQVSLWQKKIGGPLNIHIRLQGFNVGGHHGAHHAIQQEVDSEPLVSSGHKHGLHVHSNGDLSNGCQSTGPHYNPKNAHHGGPSALVRHIGDFGNFECDDHGTSNIVFSDDVAALKGPYSIFGKSLVIHSSPDDKGQGGDEESLRTGNSGTRIACCIIEKVEKLPIRSYKAIKSASQYQNQM